VSTQDEKSFGELFVEAAEEMLAVHRGEKAPARVTSRVMTRRQTDVEPPPHYTAERIQGVREKMGVSQTVFAKLLNVSLSTVKAWEQEYREPDGPTKRLLEVAEKHPEILLAALTGLPAEPAQEPKKERLRRAS
jgi:DNA-binding transcriptional regulator YiaG